jgi:hypothetical protein
MNNFNTNYIIFKKCWITQIDMVGNTYASMVFCNMGRICSSINCFQRGNLILLSLFITRWWNHVNSTLNIAMKPLPIYKIESSMNLSCAWPPFFRQFFLKLFFVIIMQLSSSSLLTCKIPIFKFLHTPLYFMNFAKCSCT